MANLTLPTVHLNGTSAQSLLDGVQEAHEKLREATEALCAAGPNARDYYPQGAGAFDRAVDEHRSRLARLASVAQELEQIAEHLCSQLG